MREFDDTNWDKAHEQFVHVLAVDDALAEGTRTVAISLHTIPTNVEAQGILIKSGGVFDILAQGSGPVSEVKVTEGDMVKKGDVIARIDQPDLISRIRNARAQLLETRSQHSDLVRYTNKNLTLDQENFLLQEGTDLKYGARHLKRAIERHLVYPMSNLIATGQIGLGDVIKIDIGGAKDRLVFSKERAITS